MASVISRFGDYLHEDFKMSPVWLSPKVQATVRILQRYRSPAFHCIIFVEQRQVAATLSWLLTRHQDTKDWVRSAVITGHGGISGNEALGMSESGQKHVVKKFREGELNLCELYNGVVFITVLTVAVQWWQLQLLRKVLTFR